ncbi:response regulator [Edaphobacter paludis]|uniref:Response regulator n=1 Tax=Edaphobacter paludis TaxID=3035702 RepID=A0AAU7D0U0_9BACT
MKYGRPIVQSNQISSLRRVILVADDKQSSRDLLHAILDDKYVVVEASDGEEALLMAFESIPHLVILDIHMPKRDGFGVVTELRKEPALQNVPIMALTASASLDEKDKIMNSGFDACFVKPIGPAKLREAVAALLQKKSLIT